MKKFLSLTVVGLMIATMILYANPTSTAIEPPSIGVNECPWVGCPDNLIYFEAQVYFLGYPPYDWVWTFKKTGGTGPNEFKETKNNTNSSWGFFKIFELGCNYTVEIEVTNDIGQKVTWPSPEMEEGHNYLVVFDGDLDCYTPRCHVINPLTAKYRLYFRGRNIGECTCKKGWTAAWFYDFEEDPRDVITYTINDLVQGAYLDDSFYIDFYYEGAPLQFHRLTTVLDYGEDRYEEDETNNENYINFFFFF